MDVAAGWNVLGCLLLFLLGNRRIRVIRQGWPYGGGIHRVSERCVVRRERLEVCEGKAAEL